MTFRSLLLDIEGTTSSIAFVHDVLFPYARRELRGFLESSVDDPAMKPVWDALMKDAGESIVESPTVEALERTALRLMDADSKSTGLKELQGQIWKAGYESGELKAHVYDDVPPALQRWKDAGKGIRIYSSGSIAAQKLFFGHTAAGNLLPMLDGFYDTTTGPKREAESYRRIAIEIGTAAGEILFLSDVVAELDAAKSAGMETGLMLRPGNAPTDGDHAHWMFNTFAEIA
jgi:enolase-phosphatase E1